MKIIFFAYIFFNIRPYFSVFCERPSRFRLSVYRTESQVVVTRMTEVFLAEKYMAKKQGSPLMAEYLNWPNRN